MTTDELRAWALIDTGNATAAEISAAVLDLIDDYDRACRLLEVMTRALSVMRQELATVAAVIEGAPSSGPAPVVR